jgi:uncharacterized repeat protein (TIGR03803 family)
MPSKKVPNLFLAAFALFFGFLATAVPAFAASKEQILHNFGGGTDGAYPAAGPIFDKAGNLYGTTSLGEDGAGDGAVVQLVPGTDGKWLEKVLYRFCSIFRCADGANPYAGLIFDGAGNLYGTTEYGPFGGANNFGVVFELSHGTHGRWTEKALDRLNGWKGKSPQAGMIFDAAGNLYGTAYEGGVPSCNAPSGCGTVFQLIPNKNGTWTTTVVHRFGRGKDGSYPLAPLILDTVGNLYGTTSDGGAFGSGCSGQGCGTVFELTPGANGKWTETVLHSFGHGKDGFFPLAGLISDVAGNLYGTTTYGGSFGPGTVFQLTPGANGKWTEKILHSFNRKDGIAPRAGLIFDAAGNLYGTTEYGGANNRGVVFELSPEKNSKWTVKVLHSFNNDGRDGYSPLGALALGPAGTLFGMTYWGGTHNAGTVFEITP